MYRIAIGADHRGYELKQALLTQSTFGKAEVSWYDVGTTSLERTDYPLYTSRVVNQVLKGTADYGILLCGSGIGASIAANRYKNIYAGLVWDETLARLAKEHDNVNVLVLPADYLSQEQASACITAWLSSEFKKGRYLERLQMLENYAQEKREES